MLRMGWKYKSNVKFKKLLLGNCLSIRYEYE